MFVIIIVILKIGAFLPILLTVLQYLRNDISWIYSDKLRRYRWSYDYVLLLKYYEKLFFEAETKNQKNGATVAP